MSDLWKYLSHSPHSQVVYRRTFKHINKREDLKDRNGKKMLLNYFFANFIGSDTTLIRLVV